MSMIERQRTTPPRSSGAIPVQGRAEAAAPGASSEVGRGMDADVQTPRRGDNAAGRATASSAHPAMRGASAAGHGTASGAAAGAQIDTRDRILAAAAQVAADKGAGTIALQDVADAAGVSKALIHYHFHDKEALVARLVTWLGERTVAREHGALTGATAGGAVDALWRWTDAELALGDWRVLAELAGSPLPAVRVAAIEVAAWRRSSAEATVGLLFATLALQPRVPAALTAEVIVRFADGLALAPVPIDAGALGPATAARRAAFDVFWLALLGLAD